MSFDSNFKPVLCPDAVVAPLADGEVVVATEDSRKALVLNESGAIVVSLCTGELSVLDIASVFSSTLGLEEADAERDVQALLSELEGEGLLAPPTDG